MIKVYFDKNVLSHILTNQRGGSDAHGVTDTDLKDLLEAVAAGKIKSLLGVMHLQEAAYALKAKSPEVSKEELKLIRELMYTEEIIKFPPELLRDDVRSYSHGANPMSSMIANRIDLDNLFSDSGDIEERKKAVDETTEYNAEFLDKTLNGNSNDRTIILAEFSGKQPSFEEFYNKKIVDRITEIVERVEQETGQQGLVDACKKRGIKGLLEIKSVAMAEGASLSYQYARVFNEMSEKRKARKGDASDLNHALLASAADILVTHDRDFAFWIGRIPNTKIEVLDHVHKLITRIKS